MAIIQFFAIDTLLAFAASRARTIVTLEQMSTNVLKAPIGSLKWTWWGFGQTAAPNRSTT